MRQRELRGEVEFSPPTHRQGLPASCSTFAAPSKELAGCYHLARLTDKIRLPLAEQLAEDYQRPLFHLRGVDGYFMNHFGPSKVELRVAVKTAHQDDAVMAAWFEARIGIDRPTIESCNELSANLGKPGHPMNETLARAKKHVGN